MYKQLTCWGYLILTDSIDHFTEFYTIVQIYISEILMSVA